MVVPQSAHGLFVPRTFFLLFLCIMAQLYTDMPLDLISPLERGQSDHQPSSSSSSSSSSGTSSSGDSSSGKSSSSSGVSSSYGSSFYDGTESEPTTKGSWDSDISTYPTTPFHKSFCCKCLGWTLAILLVPSIVVGILVYKRVLWFTMPTITYEKGSSLRISTLDGPHSATDYNVVCNGGATDSGTEIGSTYYNLHGEKASAQSKRKIKSSGSGVREMLHV
jgi:hypothetical protein